MISDRNIKDLHLSDEQMQIYKELSEKYYVSISTVKKIFADIFKVFEVNNIEELRLLLLQYQVEA